MRRTRANPAPILPTTVGSDSEETPLLVELEHENPTTSDPIPPSSSDAPQPHLPPLDPSSSTSSSAPPPTLPTPLTPPNPGPGPEEHHYTVALPFKIDTGLFVPLGVFLFVIIFTSLGKANKGFDLGMKKLDKALEGIEKLQKEVEALRAMIESRRAMGA